MRCAFLHLGREHLGLEWLSAALRRRGHETRAFVDGDLFGSEDNLLPSPFLRRWTRERERILAELEIWKPEVLAFATYSSTLSWCRDMARAIKARQPLPVVFGGAHASCVPETLLAFPEVDFVVQGEGELAFGELLDALEMKGDGLGIPGVWGRKVDGQIHRGGVAPAPRDLDALGPPDKDLFLGEGDPSADYLIMSGRGCPYRCSFCCEHVFAAAAGPGYCRRRSVDSVLDELLEARRRHRPHRIRFLDPVLMGDRSWFLEFMARYRREIAIPFRCFGHVARLDEAVVRALCRSGCVAVELGVQTLDPLLRQRIMPGCVPPSVVKAALRLCDRHGLRYEVDHLLGLPGEGEEQLAEAARFYVGCRRLTRLKPHNLLLFPGTVLFEEALACGQMDPRQAEALRRGEDGGGFFHAESAALEGAELDRRRFYRKLFQIMPLLGRRSLEFFLRGPGRRLLTVLPRVLLLPLQILSGAVSGDLRLLTVLREWKGRFRAFCLKPWRIRCLRLPPGRRGWGGMP